jgi:hypothetical protein
MQPGSLSGVISLNSGKISRLLEERLMLGIGLLGS